METSKKQNSRQQYASDFKEEIIRMLNSGKKVQELSKTFGIGENVLYNWNRIDFYDLNKHWCINFFIFFFSINTSKNTMYQLVANIVNERDFGITFE